MSERWIVPLMCVGGTAGWVTLAFSLGLRGFGICVAIGAFVVASVIGAFSRSA